MISINSTSLLSRSLQFISDHHIVLCQSKERTKFACELADGSEEKNSCLMTQQCPLFRWFTQFFITTTNLVPIVRQTGGRWIWQLDSSSALYDYEARRDNFRRFPLSLTPKFRRRCHLARPLWMPRAAFYSTANGWEAPNTKNMVNRCELEFLHFRKLLRVTFTPLTT